MPGDRSPRFVERPCSADDIAVALDHALERAMLGPPDDDPLRAALVRIAARYGEVVTQCVNAAPDLHLDAFAALLPGRKRPAEAARVHLSFKPAPGDTGTRVVVPANTRVALGPSEGGGEPVVFETLSELNLVRAEPVRALLTDAGHQQVADVSAILSTTGLDGCPMATAVPATYALHIGQRAAFGAPGLRQVTVHVTIQPANAQTASSQLDWVVTSAKGDLPLAVEEDTTDGFAHSGQVVLVPPASWPTGSVDGIESLWLTVRLRHPPAAVPAASRWHTTRLSALGISVSAVTAPQPVAAACHDAVPLDVTRDMFPFGERPRFGSVFQVLSPAFGEAGAKIEMLVRLTTLETATTQAAPPARDAGPPVVVWEISTTAGFQSLSVADGTRSLTQDGSLAFAVPADVGTMTIAGRSGPWLRARLASGHYGSAGATGGNSAAMVCAPVIRSLAVQSTLERGPLAAEQLVSQGPLLSAQLNPRIPLPVDAFQSPDVEGPALYVGLAAAAGALERQAMSWHVRPPVPALPLALDMPAARSAAPRWQMRYADGWRDIAVRDDSAGLTRSGIAKLMVHEEAARWQGLAWLRIVWPVESRPRMPTIPNAIAINSVAAQQTERLRNEVVGSSNGRPRQVFKALRTPIVGDVLLQVREAGDDWVIWQEVADLGDSHAASRDFAVDRSTGELSFGDGRLGRIPPPGANNVRLHEYATGGGSRGNQPLGVVAQMRSALPAVASVVSVEPATGGLDAEDDACARARASAWLRHRDRAICADDFVDLALRASPAVARAFCVAGRDLGIAAPAGAREPTLQAGVVSVIVIPHGTDPCPQPGLDLLATVQAYLDACRPTVGRLVILGPTYARVAVAMKVAARARWSPSEVAAECKRQIARFLHPLTGGLEGRGWALGQLPHRSDLYGLVSQIDGFDTASGMDLAIDGPTMGRFFVTSAGTIDIAPCE